MKVYPSKTERPIPAGMKPYKIHVTPTQVIVEEHELKMRKSHGAYRRKNDARPVSDFREMIYKARAFMEAENRKSMEMSGKTDEDYARIINELKTVAMYIELFKDGTLENLTE